MGVVLQLIKIIISPTNANSPVTYVSGFFVSLNKLINLKKMKSYIGTKKVKAKLTTREEYCKYRGWELPEDEDGNEEIYLVEYDPEYNNKPNHPDHEGYITMSPKNVFEKYYKSSDTFLNRLIIEESDLAIKIVALNTALIENKIPKSSVEILGKQRDIMEKYINILRNRISDLK